MLIFKHDIKVKAVLTLIWIGLDVPLIFNLGWNGFGSNFGLELGLKICPVKNSSVTGARTSGGKGEVGARNT